MSNNFDDFDSFEGFDDGIDTGGFDNDLGGSSEFDSNNTFEENSTESNYSAKQIGIICVILGLIIIASVFIINRVTTKPKENTGTSSVVEDKPSIVDDKPIIIESNQNNWIKFSSKEEIIFNNEYIDSVFTVTGIQNNVKIIDSESNIMVKSIINGSLSGFLGTFEIELPYNKGNKLLIGNTFNVKVQLGDYKGKKVIGEIVY